MINFAEKNTRPIIRQMWKTCFGDTEEYMDIYFSRQYKDENTLIYFQEKKAVASLQMIPYTITFYGKIVPFYYLAGLCTLPKYRRKGYMSQLIDKAFKVMSERAIPLTILVPAEKNLIKYYNKFDFEQVFEQENNPLPSLKSIIQEAPNIKDAYIKFDQLFNQNNLCVQKSFTDFVTIIDEAKLEGFPDKYNLTGMAYILDKEHLTSLYSKTHSIDIPKHINNRLLCRLLFGYKTGELGEEYKQFPVQQPVINLMLE